MEIQKKNKLAVASFIFGLLPILVMVLFYFLLFWLAKLPESIGFATSSIIFISFYFSPAVALVCGILALMRKENKFFAISGLVLGVLLAILFYVFGFGIGTAR